MNTACGDEKMTIYRPNKRKIKQPLSEKIFDTFNVVFMIMVVAIMLLPLVHVLNVSLSQGTESIKNGFSCGPRVRSISMDIERCSAILHC